MKGLLIALALVIIIPYAIINYLVPVVEKSGWSESKRESVNYSLVNDYIVSNITELVRTGSSSGWRAGKVSFYPGSMVLVEFTDGSLDGQFYAHYYSDNKAVRLTISERHITRETDLKTKLNLKLPISVINNEI